LWLDDPPRLESVFDKIGDVSFSARCAIEAGMYEWLGELMNKNHALLQELTVSSPELDRLVEAARGAGALGAKLSGGGRGGK
jgi:mevalonate kinase